MARIAVVPGDGIGSEVIEQGVRVLEALAPDLEFEHFDLGAERYLRDGTTLPDDVFERWKSDFDCIYLGALGDPRVPSNVHAKDILLGSRFRLDLFINLRPIKLLDERRCPLKNKGPDDVDIVVFRENTEGLYTESAASSSEAHQTRWPLSKRSIPERGWSESSVPRSPMPLNMVTKKSACRTKPMPCGMVMTCGNGCLKRWRQSIRRLKAPTFTSMFWPWSWCGVQSGLKSL